MTITQISGLDYVRVHSTRRAGPGEAGAPAATGLQTGTVMKWLN
jgi:hypothetical protein